jgi:transcriptional regulator GlxA family with amidase domain
MRTSSRKVALLTFDEVDLLDVASVVETLARSGRHWNFRPFAVELVGLSRGLVKSRSGPKLEVERALAECADPEIVIVPGGYGARRLLDDERAVAWLASAGAKAECLAAVGSGVLLLGRAGLLAGVNVAGVPDTAALLAPIAAGARVDPERALVEHERVITARSSSDALDLALAIVKRTLGAKLADGTARALGLSIPSVIEIGGLEAPLPADADSD